MFRICRMLIPYYVEIVLLIGSSIKGWNSLFLRSGAGLEVILGSIFTFALEPFSRNKAPSCTGSFPCCLFYSHLTLSIEQVFIFIQDFKLSDDELISVNGC